jgi:hypothetical protein
MDRLGMLKGYRTAKNMKGGERDKKGEWRFSLSLEIYSSEKNVNSFKEGV